MLHWSFQCAWNHVQLILSSPHPHPVDGSIAVSISRPSWPKRHIDPSTRAVNATVVFSCADRDATEYHIRRRSLIGGLYILPAVCEICDRSAGVRSDVWPPFFLLVNHLQVVELIEHWLRIPISSSVYSLPWDMFQRHLCPPWPLREWR